jgi:hypothetical protein
MGSLSRSEPMRQNTLEISHTHILRAIESLGGLSRRVYISVKNNGRNPTQSNKLDVKHNFSHSLARKT